ncbi:MAG: hypothetical protein LBS54_04315 [Dysgonamonadaceae bacterium]|jgi:hypothetical protein|nr:hypothetical protein [Dysgonamonadaceae bacterium]
MKKAALIQINWFVSLMGLAIEEPLCAAVIGFAWFCISTWLLIHAQNKGWTDEFWRSKLGKFLTEKGDAEQLP